MELTMESVTDAIQALDKQIERWESRLADARRKRDALKLTADYFSPATATTLRRRRSGLNVDPDAVRGMDLEQALLFIAEHNNGIVINSEARPILVEAGVLRGKQSTVSHTLCRALAESPRFSRETNGRYRLVDESDEPEDRPGWTATDQGQAVTEPATTH